MKEILKELNVEEIAHGYTFDRRKKSYCCIFCGKSYEEGLIYSSQSRNVSAERAVQEHVYDMHDGSFISLVEMDKEINGLTDVQKTLLKCLYAEYDNKKISETMGISVATVRTHKFALQKMKREALILLALLQQIEDDDLIERREKFRDLMNEASKKATKEAETEDVFSKLAEDLGGNVLHPFFMQLNNR